MIKFYNKLMHEKVARIIYDKFLSCLIDENNKINLTYHESNNKSTNCNSFGYYNLEETFIELEKYDTIIKKDFGSMFKFSHSYLRLYADNSTLKPHIDRENLDLTLSVNVHSITENPWPIHFSNLALPKNEYEDDMSRGEERGINLLKKYTKDFTSYVTHIGDGVCCTRDIPHWRNEFKASYLGDHYMQVFYHWERV